MCWEIRLDMLCFRNKGGGGGGGGLIGTQDSHALGDGVRGGDFLRRRKREGGGTQLTGGSK